MMATRSKVTSSMEQFRLTYDLAVAFYRPTPFNFPNFMKFLNKKCKYLNRKLWNNNVAV